MESKLKKEREQALENLIKETSRIDKEKNAIKARVEKLTERLNDNNDSMKEASTKGFSIKDLEYSSISEDKALIPKKIEILKKALQADYTNDDMFCVAALNYIDFIESDVKKYDDKIQSNIEELERKKLELELFEKKIEAERDFILEKTCDLLVPLKETVFMSGNGSVSGTYIVMKIKNKIKSRLQDQSL
jgi:hypothetical protein